MQHEIQILQEEYKERVCTVDQQIAKEHEEMDHFFGLFPRLEQDTAVMATWCSMKLAQTKVTGLTAAIVRRSTWQKRVGAHHRGGTQIVCFDPFDGSSQAG